MILGVVQESFPGEKRVALIPQDLPRLTGRGVQVLVQAGAGLAAGYPDLGYAAKGATLVERRDEVLERADVLAVVRGLGANPETGAADLPRLRRAQVVLGFLDPLGRPADARRLAETGVTAFAMELVPRITRAQSMDALSSMANIAGYRCVIIAAHHLTRLLPMMMTAAGTISPARFLVVGVGVAGLQAIATAKRLGAVVEAYDIRPEVEDQVRSVGGTFVKLDLSTGEAGAGDGYAKAQSEEFYRRQQELLTSHVQAADALITTAAVPGRRAPVLVTRAMLEGMRPGSVVVDLAAETGGNCEGTAPGEMVRVGETRLFGPLNLPSDLATHASQMYSRNVVVFLEHLLGKPSKEPAEPRLNIDTEDEITAATLVCTAGEVVNARVREAPGISLDAGG